MAGQTTTTSLRPAPARLASLPGVAGIAVLLASSLVLAADGAAAPSAIVPAGHHVFPSWLAGPLAGLGQRTTSHGAGMLLLALLVAWVLVVAGADALSPRTIATAIVAAHVVFLLSPPLFSADVFDYIGFGRLGVLHHLDPYLSGTASAPSDPIQPFLRWRDAHSPYGPLFTLLSYALVPLGIAGAFWAFKLIAFAASLATVALVWRTAERRGLDGRTAAALVGLSPVLLAFEVAGGHNDALVVLLTVAGIAALLGERRVASGSGALVAAAAVKASAALVAPFALIGTRRRARAVTGAGVAAFIVAVVALVGFGSGLGGLVDTIPATGRGVATFSVPNTIARLLGASGAGSLGHTLGLAVSAAAVIALLEHTRRGADWVTSAGWATLVLLCATTWLLPWYGTWLTPLAALSDSRRLRVASIAFIAYATLTRVTFLRM